PCHTFVAPGVYSISLNLISADGCAGSFNVPDMITVVADPVAAFSSDKMTVQLPESQIQFINASKNAVSYLWDFGGIFTSTQVSPLQTFTVPDYYKVTLYAYNQLGCADS